MTNGNGKNNGFGIIIKGIITVDVIVLSSVILNVY